MGWRASAAGAARLRRAWSPFARPAAAAVIVVLAIVGPVAAFGRFTLGAVEDDLRRRAAEDRSEVAQLTAHLVDVALVEAGRELLLVASRPSLREAVLGSDGQSGLPHLADIRATGDHSGAALIGPSGVVLARDPLAPDLVGIDVSDRDYFRGAVASPSWHVSEAYLARGSRAPLVSVSLALREAGRAIGVIQVTFTPQQILSTLRPIERVPGREIVLVDAGGRVIASTDPTHVPLSVVPEMSSAPGAGREVVVTAIPSADWVLRVVDDPTVLFAPQRRLAADVGVAAAAAALIALAIAIAFAYLYRALVVANERIREQAIRDELTGLYNRRFLELQLDLLTVAAERTGRPYSLLAIDLDGLKRVNDAFGHAAGDSLLHEFARTLTSALRASDLAVRAGGDEFVVLLPDAGIATAGEVALRVHAAVTRRYANVREMAVGASMGVAEWRTGRSADDVLAEADRLLYAAKRAGRGQVVCEEPAPVLLRLMEA